MIDLNFQRMRNLKYKGILVQVKRIPKINLLRLLRIMSLPDLLILQGRDFLSIMQIKKTKIISSLLQTFAKHSINIFSLFVMVMDKMVVNQVCLLNWNLLTFYRNFYNKAKNNNESRQNRIQKKKMKITLSFFSNKKKNYLAMLFIVQLLNVNIYKKIMLFLMSNYLELLLLLHFLVAINYSQLM